MKKLFTLLCILVIACTAPSAALAVSTPFLTTAPEKVLQGEPVLVTFNNVTSTSSVQRVLFDGAPISVFLFHQTVQALIGIDLHKKPGTYRLSAHLIDGTELTKDIVVEERVTVTAPLGIPKKLGGNTAQSQQTLVSTLASENASLANIRTGVKAFWTNNFQWPLRSVTVTDPYGYERQTGSYSIAHKGTDLRADEATPVRAINRGVVRVAKTYRDYGKTIVIDHGLGLMSFYMHLSKINVNVGQLVLPADTIGLSGHTGYAEQPHLHLTIRINGTSIDPMKFFALFP